MRLARFMLIAFLTIALFLSVLGGFLAVGSIKDLQETRTASDLGKIEATAMGATVAMSLERSVTQVSLALEGPIPPAFADLIAQQRQLADDGLTNAIDMALSGSPDSALRSYVAKTRAELEAVEALRREIDVQLSLPLSRRDPERRLAIPSALKQHVVTLKNATGLLRNRVDINSQLAAALSEIQHSAWEVREFGGVCTHLFCNCDVEPNRDQPSRPRCAWGL